MHESDRSPAALATVLLTALAGCGDRSTLRAERVEPPRGSTQTGLKNDSSTPGGSRINDTRYWRYEDLSDGDELTWTITVRNTGDKTVRVVGVRSDPAREKVLRPRELAGEAVTIEPTRTPTSACLGPRQASSSAMAAVGDLEARSSSHSCRELRAGQPCPFCGAIDHHAGPPAG